MCLLCSAPYVLCKADMDIYREHYLNCSYGVRSWLLTKDHKRIALLFLMSITLFFFLGGAFAVLIRLELLTPQGDLVQAETYNKLFTMHGVIMVFFFLIPSIPSVLGNFLLPMMIGARDLAFPRLNLLSWYIYTIGGLFTLGAVLSGGVDTGWTFYTPYSSVYANSHVIATAVGIFITGFSSILTGLNFIVTTHKMRAPGMANLFGGYDSGGTQKLLFLLITLEVSSRKALEQKAGASGNEPAQGT